MFVIFNLLSMVLFIPFLQLIFKNGEVVAEKVGALPKSQLEGWIDQTV